MTEQEYETALATLCRLREAQEIDGNELTQSAAQLLWDYDHGIPYAESVVREVIQCAADNGTGEQS